MTRMICCPYCENGTYYASLDPGCRGRVCEECNGMGEIEEEIEEEEEQDQ